MESPILLCIETSSPICSVALGTGTTLAYEYISEVPNGHSTLLAVMIEETLERNKISIQEIDAVVLNAGPGSYTGLRIGMSTAKGLCYAAEKPMISISAFDSMVHSFLMKYNVSEQDVLVPMIDARRMEVYTRVYDAFGNPLADQKSYISGVEGLFPSEPKGKVWLFGSGAEKMREGLSQYDCEAIGDSFLLAEGLIAIAQKRWANKQFDDIAYTTPNYGKAWQKA